MHRLGVIVAALLVTACDCGGQVGDQTVTTKAVGLWLTSNPLEAPPGSLSEGTNVVIRRNGVIEPRRGQKPDCATTGPNDAMVVFENTLIQHDVDAGVISRRLSDDAIQAYNDEAPFVAPTGSPMRFAESGGGLYATTNTGPQRLDTPTGEFVPAGVPPGLEGSAATTGSSGWLANGSTVGYRLVWGRRDGDGALMLGAPSGRFLVTNSSGGTRDVAVSTPIPDGVESTVHFLQVYRTVITATGGNDPGEDMALVAEKFPSSAEIAAGAMTVTDIAPYANGAAAYFNPSQGIGIAGAKDMPPLVTDLVEYNGHFFGVVQEYRQTLALTLLGTGGGTGVQDTDGLIFYEDGTEVFRIVGNATEDATIGQFLVETMSSAAVDIETTARSIVRVLNGYAESNVYAQYISGVNDLPGQMLLTARSVAIGVLSVRGINKSSCWLPRLGIELAANAISRVGSVVTAAVGSSLVQSLSVDLPISLIGVDPPPDDPNFPNGSFTISAVDPVGTFSYTQAGSAVSGTKDYYFFETPDVGVFEQSATPASYAFSDLEEPDAWPPRFRFQCPGPNTTLYRILPQGNALLFFTSAGLYRLTGRTSDEFALLPMDPTCKLVGQNTPVAMGNKVWACSDQGVVAISDLGVEKISEPLDQILLPYISGTAANKALFESAAFGVPYETENEYLLALPELNGEEGSAASLIYTFNAQTGTWVGPWTFDWDGETTFSAGVVGPDGHLYIAAPPFLTRERKDRTLTDYQDADDVGIPVDVATVVNTSKNPAGYKQWIETTVLLEKPQPSSVEMYFTTELDASEEGGTLTTQGNAALRTYIPLDKSRSARLTIGTRHNAPEEKLTILGYSTLANVSSTRVGR